MEVSDAGNQCSKRHVVVLLAACVAYTIFNSAEQSFPTSMAVLQKVFDMPHTLVELNYISALTLGIPFALCPIITNFVRRYDHLYRHMSCISFAILASALVASSCVTTAGYLYLSYTAISTVSACLYDSLMICIVADYFPITHPYHVLATNLYNIGFPVSYMVFNPVMAALVKALGWRSAWQILGVSIFAIGVPLGLLFKPNQELHYNPNDPDVDEEDVDEIKTKLSDTEEAMTTRIYSYVAVIPWSNVSRSSRVQLVLWMAVKVLLYGTWNMFKLNMVTYARRCGFSLQSAADAAMAYAAAQIAVTLLFGWLDRFRGWLLVISTVLTAVLAGISLVLALVGSPHVSYTLLLVSAAVYGGASQGALNLTYAASTELTGFDMVAVMSVAMGFGGLGILLGPLYGGMLVDVTHSFDPFFYAQFASYALQFVMLIAIIAIGRLWPPKPLIAQAEGYDQME